jgi:flagellar M-ring protein FliF
VAGAARFREIWRSLEPRGQLTIVIAGLLVVATAFTLFRIAARPSYTTLASDVAASETGDITSALEGAGIEYKLGGGGTTVSVSKSDVDAARVALAKDGLPRGGHVGFELFDKKSLGATDFQQRVDYQRALEGEVARTIEQIDGVQSADVQLVLPEESLFVDDGAKASAAVLLNASTLDGATIRGIAHLVSSSVKGLASDRVTITDSAGSLLWPGADGTAGSMSAGSKLQAESLYASQLAGQVNALLATTLGPGKAQARVHANLSLDQTEIQKVTYGKKGVALQANTEQETLGSKGGATTKAAAGVASNVPTYAGAATATGGGGNSNYSKKTDNTTYGVDKTVEQTQVAPGEVQKLDVALLIDSSVPAAQVAALKAAVGSAVGLDTTRGDTLAVSQVKFATPKAATPTVAGLPVVGDPAKLAKPVGIGFAALIFLFLMRRGLKRREGEGAAPEPTWLREIESAMPLAQLEAGAAVRQHDPMAEQRESQHNELVELANQQPEQVALQVAQWMKE